MNKYLILKMLIVVLFLGCKQDGINTSSTDKELDELNIRIARDPEKLNPIFNPTPTAREIYQYIFLPLADFHPEDLKLTPILIENLPSTKKDKEGLIGYEMRFKEDAKWGDGKDILAKDYVFTIKAAKHPDTNTKAWKTLMHFIKEITVDQNDPRKFTVYLEENYMLSKELAVTVDLLPQHIYDPENLLANLAIADLNDLESAKTKIASEKALSDFAQQFNDPINFRDKLIACGPYVLTDKESQQYYVLERKENYWGANYPNNPFLQAFAKKLIFKIIPDEMTATTAFKNGSIDMMKIKNSSVFHELSSSEEGKSKFQFFTPQLMRIQYLALNNENPKMKDPRVRRALAHLVDVDEIIESIDYGYGTRTVGPFHPSKNYYNKSLSPIDADLEKAKSLLKEAGWEDSDNDGDVDKLIDGKSVDMNLEFLITGSDLSKKVALIVQQQAQQAGVIIDIVEKDPRLMRKENLYTHQYEIATGLQSGDAVPDDPYTYWHSDNTAKGKRNIFLFKNNEADELIEKIRTIKNVEERDKAYLRLQEIIYEEQPVIFLYAPTEKIIAQKKLKMQATAKRPGYLANTFKHI